MTEVVLGGCSPEPLQSYGKALGVLRLIAEQGDVGARAFWRGEHFVLRTEFDAAAILRFFVEEYRPTPIVSPWNLDSGFFGGRQSLARLERLSDRRLDPYRAAIAAARQVLEEVGLGRDVSKAEIKRRLKARKAELIARLRGRLPDEAVRWLDATVVLARDDLAFPPVFGAGGSDGRFELSDAFMNALAVILEDPTRRADALESALFGVPRSSIERLTPGLFAPGGVGGPNSAEGFEGGGGTNPWDIVLAFEGLLLLAASATRRFGSQTEVRATFPFVVRAVAAGHPTATRENVRGEVWLPLWERPATLAELRHVFREGRAEWNGRPVASGLDIARALVSLGVDRGLAEFRRYGIQQRSGRSFLATPLGRFRVAWRPEALLMGEIDAFLDAVRPLRDSKETPGALLRLLRRLDDAVFAYCAEGDRARLLDLLVAIAQLDRAIGSRSSNRPPGLLPAPPLSRRWVFATRDRSSEFSIAAAIASLQPGPSGTPGAMRQHLVPVERRGRVWRWASDGSRTVVWTGRDLLADLIAVIDRRLMEAERAGAEDPLRAAWFVLPTELAAFLQGDVELPRISSLVEALSLIDWFSPGEEEPPVPPRTRPASIPVTFALIKLTAVGDRRLFAELGARDLPRLDPATIPLLRAGQVWEASRRAARRLRGVGLAPVGWERLASESAAFRPDVQLGRRFAAALAIRVEPVQSLVDLALKREPTVDVPEFAAV